MPARRLARAAILALTLAALLGAPAPAAAHPGGAGTWPSPEGPAGAGSRAAATHRGAVGPTAGAPEGAGALTTWSAAAISLHAPDAAPPRPTAPAVATPVVPAAGHESRVSSGAAPAAPGASATSPWPLVVGALGAIAVGHRRARRAVAIAIVLLLCVFAFEDGLHSVHHATDQAARDACAIAAASASLAVTIAEAPAAADVILPALGEALEAAQGQPVARVECPDQGRAPPSRL
jgi:hypothetical protein